MTMIMIHLEEDQEDQDQEMENQDQEDQVQETEDQVIEMEDQVQEIVIDQENQEDQEKKDIVI